MGDLVSPTRAPGTTPIHIMALDGIVNVNSLFTLALFLGIVNADPTDPTYTLVGDSDHLACSAKSSMAEDLIVFHVYSFCCFLFSSLIASALKQAIKATDVTPDDSSEVGWPRARFRARARALHGVVHVNTVVLRVGILASTGGSVFGCVFLMLALVNLVQIKLGILACHNAYTWAACIPLLVLVPLALVLYICIVLHAFTS